MKLSVSAYTAQASAHKNLCSYQQQRSYGATNQASTARTPSDLATVLPALKVRMLDLIAFSVPCRSGAPRPLFEEHSSESLNFLERNSTPSSTRERLPSHSSRLVEFL